MAAYRVEPVGILAAMHPPYRELGDEERRRRDDERREPTRSSAARKAERDTGDECAERERREALSGTAGKPQCSGNDADDERPRVDEWV